MDKNMVISIFRGNRTNTTVTDYTRVFVRLIQQTATSKNMRLNR